jgi:prepilin-type N-terminal cleavage/methylation domain-containing protein
VRKNLGAQKSGEAGFTLIELIIVIAIIGILAAIAVPQFMGASSDAYVAAAESVVSNLRQAQELYFAENGSYTNDLSELDNYISANSLSIVQGGASDTSGTVGDATVADWDAKVTTTSSSSEYQIYVDGNSESGDKGNEEDAPDDKFAARYESNTAAGIESTPDQTSSSAPSGTWDADS